MCTVNHSAYCYRTTVALASPTRGEVRFEAATFRYKPDVPLIDQLSLVARPGADRRDRRADRRWQDDAGEPVDAVLQRPRRRRDPHPDGVDISGVPRADLRSKLGHGAARHVAVRRHDPRQHQVRQPDRERSRHARRGEGDLRRSFRARATGRLRHRDRRREQQPQHRRETADHDRAAAAAHTLQLVLLPQNPKTP